MLSKKFTLAELIDMSLRGDEIGAVNFYILHQVLKHMAVCLNVDQEECQIEDKVAVELGLKSEKSIEGIESGEFDSDVKDFGKDKVKTEKSSSTQTTVKEDKQETGVSTEPAKKDQERSGHAKETGTDAQESMSKERTDRDSQTTLSGAPVTKIKSETKSEEIKEAVSNVLHGMQGEWNYGRLSGRVDGIDKGLHELSTIVDLLMHNLNEVDTKSAQTSEITQKLENDLGTCTERTQKLEDNFTVLNTNLDDTKARMEHEIDRLQVSFNNDFENIKDELSKNMGDIQKQIVDTQDLITPREDFSELVSRVDKLEEVKVNRDELGRFMEEGFIENFIKEHENLGTELDELKAGVSEVDENFKTLQNRIDEEIMTYIDDSFEEIENSMGTMKNKLDTLDADDINDTFARLEDQTEKLTKHVETVQTSGNRIEKEARVNSKKFSDLRDLLEKLETSKVDKSKLYELLDLKADLEAIMNKVDSSEFTSVVLEIEEKVDTLTNKVEITEKNLAEGLSSASEALSKKMYTEDFVPATEPMRNRMKAIINELKWLKELMLTKFLPVPGANRGYHKKFITPNKQESSNKETQSGIEMAKLPPIDLDSIPFPPADQPRTQDLYKPPGQKLPAIFANATPRVGLKRFKKRREIDQELNEYFFGREIETKYIGGLHTKTLPQQHGLKFTTKTLPADQKCKVLIEGIDKRIYRGSISKEQQNLLDIDENENAKDEDSCSSEKCSYESQKIVLPTAVVLHKRSTPVPSQKYVSIKVPA